MGVTAVSSLNLRPEAWRPLPSAKEDSKEGSLASGCIGGAVLFFASMKIFGTRAFYAPTGITITKRLATIPRAEAAAFLHGLLAIGFAVQLARTRAGRRGHSG